VAESAVTCGAPGPALWPLLLLTARGALRFHDLRRARRECHAAGARSRSI